MNTHVKSAQQALWKQLRSGNVSQASRSLKQLKVIQLVAMGSSSIVKS